VSLPRSTVLFATTRTKLARIVVRLDIVNTTALTNVTSLPISSAVFVAMLDTWLVTVPTVLVAKIGATTTVAVSMVAQGLLPVESPLVLEIVLRIKNTLPSWPS